MDLMLFRASAVLAACLALASCGREKQTFPQLVREFVNTSLSHTPVSASAEGYHVHEGVPLDELIDSFDEADLKKQRDWYIDYRVRLLKDVDPASLNAEDLADHEVIMRAIERQLLELDTIQRYRYDPTLYVELAGAALFNPLVLEYAPIDQRYRHIIARMQRFPALFGQARRNLTASPEIWTRTALRENDANQDMILHLLTDRCPPASKVEFRRSSSEALRAIEQFTQWMSSDLLKRTTDWRLGPEKYGAKFKAALGLSVGPAELLASAERDLREVRDEMYNLSAPLHAKMFTGTKGASRGAVIAETLARIADRHATPDTYFSNAKGDLHEAREFVRAKGLFPLPQHDNLEVIETPGFMRGVYSVGGFYPAPVLEPQLGAFYWLTPISKDAAADRIESKLREYNHYGLKILTIHEAIPGHYLQREYASRLEPPIRRTLRGIYFNEPYVEGWAVYATEVMVDEGYLGGDPHLRLTWLKQRLRSTANAILDIKMHTRNMSDEEAMDLMMNQTFQEKEEASGKLVRAKLTAAQLPTYFAGHQAWRELRDRTKQRLGAGFRLADFHEQALRPGAVSFGALERILAASK